MGIPGIYRIIVQKYPNIIYFDAQKAVEHGLQSLQEGADILDIGGESTRPGAEPVSVEE